MSSQSKADHHPIQQLFEQIAETRTIMLHVDGAGDHFQPMTALGADKGRIVIFTSRETEIGRALPAAARFTLVGKGHDYHASVQGRAVEIQEPDLRDELWNPVIAAWYPEGRDDPNLMMLEILPQHADIWASIGNPVVFGFEILKANLSESPPHVGVRKSVTF